MDHDPGRYDPGRYGPGRYGDFRDDMQWIHDTSFSVGEHRCLITAVTSFTNANMSVQQRDAVGAHMNALRNALFHSLLPHHLQAQRQAVFLGILSDFSYQAHSVFLRRIPMIKVLARAHHRAHASDSSASRNGPHREDFESCTSLDTVTSRPVNPTADYVDTSDHGNRIEDLDSTVAQETHASRAPSPKFTTPLRQSPSGDSIPTNDNETSDYGNGASESSLSPAMPSSWVPRGTQNWNQDKYAQFLTCCDLLRKDMALQFMKK